MSTCPFCKSPLPKPGAACPKCQAAEMGSGWDDDDLGQPGGGTELSLSRAGPAGSPGSASASAYSGGGVGLGDEDDPFAEDLPGGSLELDLPQNHAANAPRSFPSSGALPAAPPGSQRLPDLAAPPPPPPVPARDVPVPPSAPVAPPPPPPAPPPPPVAMIARFPPPPEKVWESPGYAIKVLLRQLELRQDLATLRKRRSPDVALYEAALKTHDAKTFATGIAIIIACLMVVTLLAVLRVVLKYSEE